MENIKDIPVQLNEQLQKLLENTNQRKKYVLLLLVSIIIVIVYSILSFVSKKINLNKSNCKNIASRYTDKNMFSCLIKWIISIQITKNTQSK